MRRGGAGGRDRWGMAIRWGAALLAVALLAVAVPTTQPGHAQEDDEEDRNAVTVALSPSARQVAPGGELSYTIRVRAPRSARAQRVRVLLVFNNPQLTPRTARFEDDDDWVSRLTTNEMTVTFGPLEADEQRRGTIVFQVDPLATNYSRILLQARYDWRAAPGPSTTPTPTPDDDDEDEPNIRVDVPEVTVLSPNAPPARTEVWPGAAPGGTGFQFHAVNFAPGEAYVTWLNTPDGVRELPNRGVATLSGEIWVGLESAGFRPGAYSIVIYGLRSQQTGVGPFIVQ